MSDVLEEMAFRDIANAHPHEVHEAYPDRFWLYFHERFPVATREQMEGLLNENEQFKRELENRGPLVFERDEPCEWCPGCPLCLP